jgi:hypothetical protein
MHSLSHNKNISIEKHREYFAKMPYPTMHIEALLKFIQIFDSPFPLGIFTYSFELEPHAVLGIVKNAKYLKRFLENIIIYRHSKMEFPTVLKVYKLRQKQPFKPFIELDAQFSSMCCYALPKLIKLSRNYFSHLKDLKPKKKYHKTLFQKC